MKSRRSITIILLLIIASPLLGQKEIGKLFILQEAQKLFGEVTIEKEISVTFIKETMAQSSDHVSFNIVNNQLFVLGDSKTLKYPATKYSEAPNVFFIFSISMISKFLDTNPSIKKIKVQMRGNVLCLYNEKMILELSLQCPPYCWEK